LRRGDLDRAVQLGLQQLNAAGWPHRSLFVLSDFARAGGFDAQSLGAPGVRIAVERIGTPPTRCNLYLEQLHAAADPAEPDKTSISVAVGSACAPGARAPTDVKLEVVARGQTLARSDVALQNGQAKLLLSVPTP